MKAVLIGAGRLATNLGQALVRSGHEVVCVVSRSERSASALGRLLQCPYCTAVADMPSSAGIYIVSVSDDALPSVAASLPPLPDALVVHTAGSLPLQVFEGTSVVRGGVFYPMQTFSKEVVADFSAIPCFIETSRPSDLCLLERFSLTLSRKVYPLSSERRRYLHLAAVFACNFSNYCYAMADRLLTDNGLPFDVMLPLIDQTARKVHSVAPVEGLTGPAARDDRAVMEAQAALLDAYPGYQDIYRKMSLGIRHTVQQNRQQKEKRKND